MLKIQFKDKRSEAVWIVGHEFTLGSESGNNLIIADPSVSPVHAKLLTKDNKLFLLDNGSETGCFINDQRVSEQEISSGDVIRLGDVDFDILSPKDSISQPAFVSKQSKNSWSLVADSSWLSGQEFPISGKVSGKKVTIGRDSNCDIVIPGTHLSRQHAEITIEDSRLLIRDLGSANGTFINEEKVTQGYLRAGDKLKLDVYSFSVSGPGDKNLTRVRTDNPLKSASKSSTTDSSYGEKAWKTRPTSPGNREETELQSSSGLWWVGALLLILLGYFIYLIVQR